MIKNGYLSTGWDTWRYKLKDLKQFERWVTFVQFTIFFFHKNVFYTNIETEMLNISFKNKPKAGWKEYNFECWKSELYAGQNSQISYSFTLNDLILFHQYILSHSRHIHSHRKQNFYSTQLLYSFNILCASLFTRQWLNPRLLPLDSYLLETRVFKDTGIPNVFLVSMDVTRAPDVTTCTHRGDTQKCFIRLRPEVQPLTLFYWRMIPFSHT